MNWSPFWPSASSAGGGEKLFWPDLSLNFSPLHGPSRFIEFNRDVVEAVNIARTTGNPFFLESVGVSEGGGGGGTPVGGEGRNPIVGCKGLGGGDAEGGFRGFIGEDEAPLIGRV